MDMKHSQAVDKKEDEFTNVNVKGLLRHVSNLRESLLAVEFMVIESVLALLEFAHLGLQPFASSR